VEVALRPKLISPGISPRRAPKSNRFSQYGYQGPAMRRAFVADRRDTAFGSRGREHAPKSWASLGPVVA